MWVRAGFERVSQRVSERPSVTCRGRVLHYSLAGLTTGRLQPQSKSERVLHRDQQGPRTTLFLPEPVTPTLMADEGYAMHEVTGSIFAGRLGVHTRKQTIYA